MTLKELQQFLDAEKWKDSEIHSCDMCGRYARCRYCVRSEQYPCAMAHNRLMSAIHAPVPDRIPEWLLPEPEIPSEVPAAGNTKFSAESAEGDKSVVDRQKDVKAQTVASDTQTETADGAAASESPAEQEPFKTTAQEEIRKESSHDVQVKDDRPHVIRREKRGEICLCRLGRRIPTVSSVSSEA